MNLRPTWRKATLILLQVLSYQQALSNPGKAQWNRSDVIIFLSEEHEYRLRLSTTVYVRCVGDAALLLSCESLGGRYSFLSLPLFLLQHSDHHFLPTSWTIPGLHSVSCSSFRDLPVLHLALARDLLVRYRSQASGTKQQKHYFFSFQL